jgi:cell division protein ZapA (FtsZ GTPase activity inhibitor)
MSKAIRVTIGGKDLTLRGNDAEKIKKSVREVNLQVQHLQQTLREQSTPTLTILAALNIAEKYLDVQEQRANDLELVTDELTKMTEYLDRAWSQPLS